VEELDTRLLPWEAQEISWAWNRPHRERPPLPKPGDRVRYRHQHWDAETVPAVVVSVQDPDELDDGNLWILVRDIDGQPIFDDGVPRWVRCPDPWPLVRLDTGDLYGVVNTLESRVRGSAGWLPLDWQARPERARLPSELALLPREPRPPLNVPLHQLTAPLR
jgi:hypothetical protein